MSSMNRNQSKQNSKCGNFGHWWKSFKIIQTFSLVKPFATSLSLNCSIEPSTCLFNLYIHLIPIAESSLGKSKNSHMWLSLRGSTFLFIATIHLEIFLCKLIVWRFSFRRQWHDIGLVVGCELRILHEIGYGILTWVKTLEVKM